jgi:hypothetical protein
MSLYWSWGEGLRAFLMLWSHVSCAVGEGGWGLQRPEHLQQAHVKTFFHVSISQLLELPLVSHATPRFRFLLK